MRQRAEKQAEEKEQYQGNAHDAWLEQQISAAFDRHEAGESVFISNDEMNSRMDGLKALAAQGKL